MYSIYRIPSLYKAKYIESNAQIHVYMYMYVCMCVFTVYQEISRSTVYCTFMCYYKDYTITMQIKQATIVADGSSGVFSYPMLTPFMLSSMQWTIEDKERLGLTTMTSGVLLINLGTGTAPTWFIDIFVS